MLESFVEMDSIAERGYMPSNTQVSLGSFVSLSALKPIYQFLFVASISSS